MNELFNEGTIENSVVRLIEEVEDSSHEPVHRRDIHHILLYGDASPVDIDAAIEELQEEGRIREVKPRHYVTDE